MFLKLDERTLPIGDFLRNNGLQLPKIWQRPQLNFVLSCSHPKKLLKKNCSRVLALL